MEHAPAEPVDLHDRAVDQLVDETSTRLRQLRHLLGADHPFAAWPARALRSAATDTVARLRSPSTGEATARALLAALWPSPHPDDVPPWWWRTPLGRLVQARTALAAAPARTAPTRRETSSRRDELSRP
jgi:hypothetical protein